MLMTTHLYIGETQSATSLHVQWRFYLKGNDQTKTISSINLAEHSQQEDYKYGIYNTDVSS